MGACAECVHLAIWIWGDRIVFAIHRICLTDCFRVITVLSIDPSQNSSRLRKSHLLQRGICYTACSTKTDEIISPVWTLKSATVPPATVANNRTTVDSTKAAYGKQGFEDSADQEVSVLPAPRITKEG
ncbi:hypothetical protein CEXT_197781 [Caerostris extrusa]|uniref:Uncharacterized protein n=1 Tax=Caerostris extrusa TaxID=172846 RepID=A0AAV4TXB6_CAEEX|nr:hypothetical protein CEXT_197781 [Caerostris extrusa]